MGEFKRSKKLMKALSKKVQQNNKKPKNKRAKSAEIEADGETLHIDRLDDYVTFVDKEDGELMTMLKTVDENGEVTFQLSLPNKPPFEEKHVLHVHSRTRHLMVDTGVFDKKYISQLLGDEIAVLNFHAYVSRDDWTKLKKEAKGKSFVICLISRRFNSF